MEDLFVPSPPRRRHVYPATPTHVTSPLTEVSLPDAVSTPSVQSPIEVSLPVSTPSVPSPTEVSLPDAVSTPSVPSPTEVSLPDAVSTSSGSPSPRSEHVVTSFGRWVLLFGGKGENGVLLGDTWVYDVRTGEWRQLAARGGPGPRSRAAVAVDRRGRAVVVGGVVSKTDVCGEVWSIDLREGVRGVWKREPDVGARCAAGAAMNGSTLVVFGGASSPSASDALGDIWRVRGREAELFGSAETPLPRSYPIVQPVGDEVWIGGGVSRDGAPLTDVWRVGPRGCLRDAEPLLVPGKARRTRAVRLPGDRLLLWRDAAPLLVLLRSALAVPASWPAGSAPPGEPACVEDGELTLHFFAPPRHELVAARHFPVVRAATLEDEVRALAAERDRAVAAAKDLRRRLNSLADQISRLTDDDDDALGP